MIKAVLFDMDGVLVDTEWFYNRRRVAFMEEKGFHFDEIPDLSGSNEPAIWEALVPDDVELRERLRVEYKQVYSPDHPVPYAELLNEQTEPVMRALHERGVKCAIASSSYRELIDELVEIAGIADVLDYTISGHECSAFKPDPEIYLRAMERRGGGEPGRVPGYRRIRLWGSRLANVPAPASWHCVRTRRQPRSIASRCRY